MDSYEKIRKMGEISKELKKHGLAEDSADALKKAENIILDNDKEFYVSQDEMNENIKKAENCCVDANHEIKKITVQFNDKIAGVESQISLVREKVNEIIAKLNDIESKVNAKDRQEIQETLVAANTGVREKQEEESKTKVKPEVKKEYSSNDVSVDKMFYSGNK